MIMISGNSIAYHTNTKEAAMCFFSSKMNTGVMISSISIKHQHLLYTQTDRMSRRVVWCVH